MEDTMENDKSVCTRSFVRIYIESVC